MPEHFGDPFREQRALAHGDAVVLRDDVGIIRLSGRDRLTWLDSLMSQHLADLDPGDSAEALLLDPNGRIERVLRVTDDGVATWLLIDADTPGLAAWLDGMVFRRDVEVTLVSDDLVVVGIVGDGCAAPATLPLAFAPNGVSLVWLDPWSRVAPGGWQYAGTDGHPADAWVYREVVLDAAGRESLEHLCASGEVARAGSLALDALRIAAWRPALADVDDTSLPHEFDWLRSAVHLSKGCYRGQETVAKVHNLGHPPRRLVALDLDGSEAVLPEPGWVVALADPAATAADPTPVGHITSAARHFDDGPIALALVKRNVPVDAPLVVLDPAHPPIAATQVVIVPPDAGKAVDVSGFRRDRVRPTRS